MNLGCIQGVSGVYSGGVPGVYLRCIRCIWVYPVYMGVSGVSRPLIYISYRGLVAFEYPVVSPDTPLVARWIQPDKPTDTHHMSHLACPYAIYHCLNMPEYAPQINIAYPGCVSGVYPGCYLRVYPGCILGESRLYPWVYPGCIWGKESTGWP